MPEYAFTEYFEREVLRKRPYLQREWRFWAPVAGLGGRFLRVITLDDRVTIRNALPDRGFMP